MRASASASTGRRAARARAPAAAVKNCMPRVRKRSTRKGCTCGTRPQRKCSRNNQESGMREYTERRKTQQQDTQFYADNRTDAHERRHKNAQHQQMMHDGGGRPGGDPDVCRAHALKELLAGIETGKNALRIAGSGLRSSRDREYRRLRRRAGRALRAAHAAEGAATRRRGNRRPRTGAPSADGRGRRRQRQLPRAR